MRDEDAYPVPKAARQPNGPWDVVLQCPKCTTAFGTDDFACRGCGATYPLVRGIPVLIDEGDSVFSFDDVRRFAVAPTWARRTVQRLLPRISSNLMTERVYQQLRDLLLFQPNPTVLCIGNADGGQGFAQLRHPRIRIISTDIAITSETNYAVDAHSLPFADSSFDAVVAQAVLEHVADPNRCVAEIHRVLRTEGLVFAETPFMQQVHLGKYDFTRFTHLGHRRLFRMFSEIESGQVASAGSSLAWSLTYFLTSLTSDTHRRHILQISGRLLFFWLKYLDRWISHTSGSWDGACSFYFFGKRATEPISDRAVVAGYRGTRR
jgi:SAM-dependent methyltransferase